MTVAEILQQAQALTIEERKELMKSLVDMIDVPAEQNDSSSKHWGRSLNRLLETMDAGEWGPPGIDDPVEAVKMMREAQRKKRLGDWGEEN